MVLCLASNPFLLFAADDWWQVVGTIILFLFYGIGQLLSGRDDAKKRAKEKARRAKRPPVAQGGDKPQNQADPLRAEVEEFLRRAEGKKPEEKAPQRERETQPLAREPAAPAARREPQPPRARPLPESRVGQPAKQPPRAKPKPAIPASERKLPEQQGQLRREGVAEHVQRHLSKGRISEHAEHLGDEVALADDKMEARIEQKFEHRLGRLGHQQEAVAEKAGPALAQEVRELLSDSRGMRRLIVANEILRRPEERW